MRYLTINSDFRELLSEYFGPVQHLSDKMEKQIKFVLRRTLNTVQREPKVRLSKYIIQ